MPPENKLDITENEPMKDNFDFEEVEKDVFKWVHLFCWIAEHIILALLYFLARTVQFFIVSLHFCLLDKSRMSTEDPLFSQELHVKNARRSWESARLRRATMRAGSCWMCFYLRFGLKNAIFWTVARNPAVFFGVNCNLMCISKTFNMKAVINLSTQIGVHLRFMCAQLIFHNQFSA